MPQDTPEIPGLKEEIAKGEFKEADDDSILRVIQDPNGPVLNFETPMEKCRL
jgi:hypothetical protein